MVILSHLKGVVNSFIPVRESLSDSDYLERIGAVARFDLDGKLYPTLAGLLMFGHEYQILRELPEYFLDFRELLDPTISGGSMVLGNKIGLIFIENYVIFYLTYLPSLLTMLTTAGFFIYEETSSYQIYEKTSKLRTANKIIAR